MGLFPPTTLSRVVTLKPRPSGPERKMEQIIEDRCHGSFITFTKLFHGAAIHSDQRFPTQVLITPEFSSLNCCTFSRIWDMVISGYRGDRNLQRCMINESWMTTVQKVMLILSKVQLWTDNDQLRFKFLEICHCSWAPTFNKCNINFLANLPGIGRCKYLSLAICIGCG